MFERLLLAVDGSEGSRRAGEVATELARLSGGEVIVCHVTEAEPEMSRGGLDPGEAPEHGEGVATFYGNALEDVGVRARIVMRVASHSHVASQIVEVAREEDVSVIVMGSRGLSDWSAAIIGSIAHKVLHLADRPVIVAR
jgi:nucleotide-binding universal stress UspA family protein